MMLQRQSSSEEWIQPQRLLPLLFSCRGLPASAAGLSAGSDSGCAGGSNFEGEGGVSAPAAASLEGVALRIDVVDAEVAATKALRDCVAPSLFAPLPGVACTGITQGMEFEELTDRYRHARTALAVAY